MLEHKKIQNLSDYFVELNSRREKGVYFYRINGYSEEVGEFIKKYYDTARRTGVVIEGKSNCSIISEYFLSEDFVLMLVSI